MYKRLIVAVDGSDGSVAALKAATEIAKASGTVLTALYVYEPPAFFGEVIAGSAVSPIGGLDPSVFDDLQTDQLKRIHDSVDAAMKDSGVRYDYQDRTGQPAHTIVHVAEEHRCDLIVIGSRGLSGIKSLLLGSVSERVAHLAHCSVLIAR